MSQRLPKPDDFRSVFLALGWQGVRARFCVGAVTINRWIDEEGREQLAAARAASLERLREQDRALRQRVAVHGDKGLVVTADRIAKIGCRAAATTRADRMLGR